MTTTHNWQTLDTAPRDGTHILFFYGLRNAVFTAWYEKEYEYTLPSYIVDNQIQDIPVYSYWHLQLASENDDIYFEEENPANCYWQPMMELPV